MTPTRFKLIASVLLFLGSVTVHAAEIPSHFATLQTWFDAGTEVAPAEIMGAYSGRCFDDITPNTPANGLLMTARPEGSPGPGLPAIGSIFSAAIFRRQDNGGGGALPPHFFDNYDLGRDPQGVRAVFHGEIRRRNHHPVFQTEAGIYSWHQDYEPNGRLDFLGQARRHQDYVVVRYTNLIANNRVASLVTGQGRTLELSKVFVMCYFFKSLN